MLTLALVREVGIPEQLVVVDHLNELSAADSKISSRVTEMAARMGTLRNEVRQKAAAVPAPDDATVAQLWEKARKDAAP